MLAEKRNEYYTASIRIEPAHQAIRREKERKNHLEMFRI
jgi:hypothetical protein